MTPPLSFDQTVELDRDSKSQRIDRRWEAARDDSLNCFISISEAAPPLPEGPLTGLVFGVKDNIDVEGFPTTLGSLLGDPNPQTGSADVVRLCDALKEIL